MSSEISKFTIRTDAELLKKFRFVAEYNARSANKEIEVLMKIHILEFEKQHGKTRVLTHTSIFPCNLFFSNVNILSICFLLSLHFLQFSCIILISLLVNLF